MELPQYDQYSKWFGDGPYSVHMGMNQMDLAQQFQQQKLQQEQENTKAKSLANMYSEQVNPLQVKQQEQLTQQQQYQTSDMGVKSRNVKANEPFQLTADQKALVAKASKSDLDSMEYEFQRMAYSQDPATRALGETGMKMHKSFVMLREKGDNALDKVDAQGQNALAVQLARNAGAERTANINAAARLAAKQRVGEQSKNIYDLIAQGKLTPDKAATAMSAMALKAQASKDGVLASEYDNAAKYFQQLAPTVKTDNQAGKVDIGAVTGLPTIPARQPISTQGATGSFDTPKQQHSLADVQKLYPGVPVEKLKQAYKAKNGVDLK
jgi:hypothetical protein